MKNTSDKKTTLEIHVQPGARRNEVIGFKEGVLNVKVVALPQKGQANRALVELMAKALGIPKSNIDVIRGQSSRNKVIAIQGLTGTEVKQVFGQDPSHSDFTRALRNETS